MQLLPAMTRILAGVFAICAVGCAFDPSGAPSAGTVPDGQAVAGPPDAGPAGTIDAGPPSPPDACVGKRCDGDNGGGKGPGG